MKFAITSIQSPTQPITLARSPQRVRGIGRRAVALACVYALMFTPAATAPALAGNLDAEMNTMFNSLGVLGNVTSPGAFRG